MKATRRARHVALMHVASMRVALMLVCAWTVPGTLLAQALDKRVAQCWSCHGDDGQSPNPETPSLGAQTAPYALIQLYLFREKLRLSDLMNKAMAGFTDDDDDLRTFADTISKLPPPPPMAETVDPARMDRGRALVHQYRCNVCHTPDLAGRDAVPRIAGQREDFLVKTMREYKANIRAGYDASMGDVLQPIPDADILDLAYFAARQP
jgi:cytochrome c553